MLLQATSPPPRCLPLAPCREGKCEWRIYGGRDGGRDRGREELREGGICDDMHIHRRVLCTTVSDTYAHIYNVHVYVRICTHVLYIIESVDSLCRDGAGPPIVCIHWKAVLTRECSCSKPFWTPSYPIPMFLYPMIPPR